MIYDDLRDLNTLALLVAETFHAANEAYVAAGRRWWTRPLNSVNKRREQGATMNLLREMRQNDDESFFVFTRMNFALFDKLLRLIGPSISKISPRESISPQERLLITLR